LARVIHHIIEFNYLRCQLGSNRNYGLPNKWHRFNYLCGAIKRTLLKSQQDTTLTFSKVSAVPSLLFGTEYWMLIKQQLQQIKFFEMRFLRDQWQPTEE
jgi:hypothetical protein